MRCNALYDKEGREGEEGDGVKRGQEGGRTIAMM
jgi:hypothetical protein